MCRRARISGYLPGLSDLDLVEAIGACEPHESPTESVTVPFPRGLINRYTSRPVTDQEFETLRGLAQGVIESELRMLMVYLIANSDVPSKYNEFKHRKE